MAFKGGHVGEVVSSCNNGEEGEEGEDKLQIVSLSFHVVSNLPSSYYQHARKWLREEELSGS